MLRVLLLQLPVPNNPASNVPLAAGYLKAYAEAQGLGQHVEIAILPRAIADHGGDAKLVQAISAEHPDVLGISLYTWNSERSLALALRLKAALPALRVVVGGPEVQADNHWLLEHPAVDVAVIGEGEQSFCALLGLWSAAAAPDASLATIPGLAYRVAGQTQFTAERVALSDLAAIPSPYLAGHLDMPPGGMLMVEVSRWCPYSCSFCLYGRNMGPKLGSRYFGLERVLAEIVWGKAQGVSAVHFVEANLNLVPLFWPLMRALADLNADKQLTFYAELRGEHLTDAVVAALERANVRVVEVGLQTANPAALKASLRRTDLHKWAAGTRRLYAQGIEVYLDVILGLPADDADGVAETLDFLRREQLGAYDIFMLQVLPGTAVRRQAQEFGLVFQQRPPYYVLASDRLSYAELRQLRHQLKQGIDLDPDAVEGMPEPRRAALASRPAAQPGEPITRVKYADLASAASDQLASHVDVVAPSTELDALQPWLAEAIVANPSTLFDLYLLAEEAPDPAVLASWRAALPYTPGYLDRVAVYRRAAPTPDHERVSPRLWLVLPWTAQADPRDYAGLAELIWRYDILPGETPPLGAWRGAGGAGIWLPGAIPSEQAQAWEEQTGLRIWYEG